MEYDINSFNDYVELLKKYRKEHSEELWLRGQRDSTWKLEPNLYRNKVLDVDKNGISVLKYKSPNFLEEFDRFIDKIKKDKLYDISKLNRFQIMFLGQHYGLLTPVLDWTTDPLAAMFFAIDGYKYKDRVFPVIYIMSPSFCNSNSDKVWKSDGSKVETPICIDGKKMDYYFDDWVKTLEKGSYIPTALCSKQEYSFRISRQSGNFTLHSPIQPLNYSWNNVKINNRQLVDIFTINPKAVKEIKSCLECLNINKSTLYKIDSDKLDDECANIKNESLKKFEDVLKSK